MRPVKPIERVDEILRLERWKPYFGWHDDHRHLDGTADYKPALMQVRAEHEAFLAACDKAGALGGACLQLGMGESQAAHEALLANFHRVVTIDFGVVACNGIGAMPGGDTHSPKMVEIASRYQPFDVLFIDAGHTFDDVAKDFEIYAPMVRHGGLIVFHDALPRPAYPEVEVWRFLERLEKDGVAVSRVGDEVGTAWVVK